MWKPITVLLRLHVAAHLQDVQEFFLGTCLRCATAYASILCCPSVAMTSPMAVTQIECFGTNAHLWTRGAGGCVPSQDLTRRITVFSSPLPCVTAAPASVAPAFLPLGQTACCSSSVLQQSTCCSRGKVMVSAPQPRTSGAQNHIWKFTGHSPPTPTHLRPALEGKGGCRGRGPQVLQGNPASGVPERDRFWGAQGNGDRHHSPSSGLRGRKEKIQRKAAGAPKLSFHHRINLSENCQ